MGKAASLPFVCACAMGVVLALPWHGAGQDGDFVVRVRTYVQARSQFSLTAAMAEATGIMRRAHVDIRWKDCTADAGCGQLLEKSELVLRLRDGNVPPDDERKSDQMVLAEAMLDAETGTGVFADVMVARVLAFVRNAPGQRDRMLGRVLAHEMSHLLLGNRNHGRLGLMRRVWLTRDIEFPDRWQIASPQREQLAATLAKRRPVPPWTSASEPPSTRWVWPIDGSH